MTDVPDHPSLAPAEPGTGESVRLYGRPQGPDPAAQPQAQSGTPMPAQVTTFPMSFTGNAGEFFRIWIVNVALSVVTLGLYTPWARVRTRQYFFGNTWVDGHNFEYTANPIALLKGYLIVAFFFGAYNAAMQFQFQGWEWVVGLIGLLFVGIYPWLVRQSMRFLARSTVHRGLNFRFLGSMGEAYVSYGLANIASGLVLPALPWAWFMQRRYQVEGVHYGQAKGHFRGDIGPFYIIGLTAFGLTLAGIAALVLIGLGLAVLAGVTGADWLKSEGAQPGVGGMIGLVVGIALVYGAFILLYLGMWQYVRAATMKYVLNNVELGGVVRLSATFNPWTVMWIGLGNTLAQVVSLGLLTPWAMIRRTKYVTEHIQVRTITNLDDFTADQGNQESALGEAATELLDINLGF